MRTSRTRTWAAPRYLLGLLLLGSFRKSARAVRDRGNPMVAPGSPVSVLIRGIVGSLIVVVGLHLFAGGLAGQILSAAVS